MDMCNLLFYSKEMVDLENNGKGHGVQYSKWSYPKENIILNKCHTWSFFASSLRFRDVQHSTQAIFTFQIFARVRPERTNVTDIHRHIECTKMDKPIAIDNHVQIYLKADHFWLAIQLIHVEVWRNSSQLMLQSHNLYWINDVTMTIISTHSQQQKTSTLQLRGKQCSIGLICGNWNLYNRL